MANIETGATMAGISIGVWKWIVASIAACCTLLGVNSQLILAWFVLMALDTLIAMAHYSVQDQFSWKKSVNGIIGKIAAFIVIISFAIVGYMAKEHDIYLMDVIAIGMANTLILANGAGEALSVLSHYRQMKGKEPLPEVDIFGIFGKRFRSAMVNLLSGEYKKGGKDDQ